MANPPKAMDLREKILREGVLKHRQTSIALPRVSVVMHDYCAFCSKLTRSCSSVHCSGHPLMVVWHATFAYARPNGVICVLGGCVTMPASSSLHYEVAQWLYSPCKTTWNVLSSRYLLFVVSSVHQIPYVHWILFWQACLQIVIPCGAW